MALSLLPICRAYHSEVDAELKKAYPDLTFGEILFPSFDGKSIFVQACLRTICCLETISQYYPDGKTLEVAICYHWKKIHNIQYKKELMLSGFTNFHQKETFEAYTDYLLDKYDYRELLIQHMQHQSDTILKKSGLSDVPCYFVFYIPRYRTNLFYAIPVVVNEKIPEGKFFLQTIRLW